MRLFLDIGYCERSAKRGSLPGSCATIVADNLAEAGHGVMLACAEGIANRPDPEPAARCATTTLGDIYYSAPTSGSTRSTLQEGMNAANRAIRAAGERGRAAAVAALVLQGRRWYTAHAGHIRVWRYRDPQIKQLTRDHLLPRAPGQVEVTRACGYGDAVEADYGEGELKEGDLFVLTSPGVHDVLPGAALLGVLQMDGTAQQIAELLVQQAFAIHAPAYAGVCVARVEKLPAQTDSYGAVLPVIELPKPGAEIDGFVIEKLVLKSRRFRLYRARDRESDETITLRFPDPAYEENTQAFLREESIGRRVDSPYLLKPITLRAGRRTALYAVIEYRKTENLAKRIRRKQGLPTREALRLADQLLGVLETFHRQGVIHGDVRPHNVLYDKTRRQIYLFGIAGSPGGARKSRSPSGILSYCAPEIFDDSPGTERSDVFSAGVTLYRMLTNEYPYGRIRSDMNWKEPQYTPIQRHREALPVALDDVLARACAPDPKDRYASVAQFAAALSAVQVANPGSAPPPTTARSAAGAQAQWAWGLAAGLLAALLGYLYVALR